MTGDQIGGIIRAAIPFLTMIGAQYGFDSAQVTAGLTALASLVVAVWSIWTNSQKQMIASVNNTDNGVKVVAGSSPGATVTAPLKGK